MVVMGAVEQTLGCRPPLFLRELLQFTAPALTLSVITGTGRLPMDLPFVPFLPLRAAKRSHSRTSSTSPTTTGPLQRSHCQSRTGVVMGGST